MEGNANGLVLGRDGQSDLSTLLNVLGPIDLVESVCKNLQEQLIGISESQNDKKMYAKSIIGDNVYSNISLKLPAISSAIKVDGSKSTLSTGNNGKVIYSATAASQDDNNANEATTEQEIYPSPVVSKSHILVQNKPIKIAIGHHDCCRSDEKHPASKKRNESLPSCEQFQPKQLRKLNSSPVEEKSNHTILISESVKDKFWRSRYKELLEYKRDNGHTLVSRKYAPNPQLGTWVNLQRQMFKKGMISCERMDLLSKIGFVWDHKELVWREQFLKLKQYKQIHGHTFVPCRYEKDRKLGIWVKKQRLFYWRYQRGEKPGIKIKRLEALNDIGFEWNGKVAFKKRRTS